MGRLASVILVLSFLAHGARAQAVDPAPPTRDSITVAAGQQYEAGGLFTAFMGQGYRSLWTTPIRVPVADLSHWRAPRWGTTSYVTG